MTAAILIAAVAYTAIQFFEYWYCVTNYERAIKRRARYIKKYNYEQKISSPNKNNK